MGEEGWHGTMYLGSDTCPIVVLPVDVSKQHGGIQVPMTVRKCPCCGHQLVMLMTFHITDLSSGLTEASVSRPEGAATSWAVRESPRRRSRSRSRR